MTLTFGSLFAGVKPFIADRDRLRAALEMIRDEQPRGSAHQGGETYFALNKRLQDAARAALSSGGAAKLMNLNITPEWILNAAEKEAGGIISAGGLVSRIREAEAGGAATEKPSREWQPIETAPRDGRKVLLWYPNGDYHVILEWNEYRARWEDGFTDGHQFKDFELSHWQPLPEAPVAGPS